MQKWHIDWLSGWWRKEAKKEAKRIQQTSRRLKEKWKRECVYVCVFVCLFIHENEFCLSTPNIPVLGTTKFPRHSIVNLQKHTNLYILARALNAATTLLHYFRMCLCHISIHWQCIIEFVRLLFIAIVWWHRYNVCNVVSLNKREERLSERESEYATEKG